MYDDDDFALADSFINFDYSPNIHLSDPDPDPVPDPDSSLVDFSIQERIDFFPVAENQGNQNVEISSEIIANDVTNFDFESGEIIAIDFTNFDFESGEIIANHDANEIQIENSDSESESESSDRKIHEEYELEEGEIVDSDYGDDDDFDDSDDDSESTRRGVDVDDDGFENLPRVPTVNVNLGPHHQMLPVGVVTSIVGAKVIVEGVEKHDPLNDGSILWITEKQTPLGLIDELFGPVEDPYYVVRYNSENEVPEGIHEGTLISYVEEFANHVVNDKGLYEKGYDDESDESDEAEFSDDAKEEEYKRQQQKHRKSKRQQQKHGKSGPTNQNLEYIKNCGKEGPPKDGSILTMPVAPAASFVPQGHCPPIPGTGQGFFGAAQGHCLPLPGIGQGFCGPTNVNQPFPPVNSDPNLYTARVSTNGVTLPPQHSVVPSNGFPLNGVSWHPENTQISHHWPVQGIPFQQQSSPSHNMYAQGPINQNQWQPFPQIQPPTNFHASHVLGNQSGPPHQFNPFTDFHSTHVSGNQGCPPHQFNPPANFHSTHVSGNQNCPPNQFNAPANFHLTHVSGNQVCPPQQFNPPANFHSSHFAGNQGDALHQFNHPTNVHSSSNSGNQHPLQFPHQFNPGTYDGHGRTFPAGRGRRPFHRGGRGWRPSR